MKKYLLLSIGVLFFASTSRAQTYFDAFLTTSEEPGVVATSFGYGTFMLSADQRSLHYEIMVWGISDIQAAHFHMAARGADGITVKQLYFSDKRACVGTWSDTSAEPLTPTIVAALLKGNIYVNVHTLLNSGGEIRGQLFQPVGYATLATNKQEVTPPVPSGHGEAIFVYNPQDTTVFYRGQVMGMSSAVGNGYIQQGAPGANGPVVDTTHMASTATDPVGAATTGMWTPTDTIDPLTPALADALQHNQLYWNVATQMHANGEVRGQIGRSWLTPDDSGMWFTAILSGAQEGSAFVPSNGQGLAILLLNRTRDTLKMQIYWSDLTGPVTHGHIHYGWAGEIPNGGANIVKEFDNTGSLLWTASDLQALTPQDIDSLFMGYYYVNIHTDKFPDGEIRGQIVPLGQPMSAPSFVAASGAIAASLQIYPNPAADEVHVNYVLPQGGQFEIVVTDPLGKVMTRYAQPAQSAGEHSISLNTESFASGVYYVQLISGTTSTRMPIVVTR